MKAEMESEAREKAYRIVSYTAILFSIISVVSICITVPLGYNYVAHIQNQMNREIEFCRVSWLSSFQLASCIIFTDSN